MKKKNSLKIFILHVLFLVLFFDVFYALMYRVFGLSNWVMFFCALGLSYGFVTYMNYVLKDRDDVALMLIAKPEKLHYRIISLFVYILLAYLIVLVLYF